MLFHLTDFSALVPTQNCDITSLGLEMMEEKMTTVTGYLVQSPI
jgi:hypothetical protein